MLTRGRRSIGGARGDAQLVAAALLAVLALACALALGSPSLARGAGAQAALVPAYFSPEGSPDPWEAMCDVGAPGSIAILNPDNGPVKSEASVYLPAMSYCRARSWG